MHYTCHRKKRFFLFEARVNTGEKHKRQINEITHTHTTNDERRQETTKHTTTTPKKMSERETAKSSQYRVEGGEKSVETKSTATL